MPSTFSSTGLIVLLLDVSGSMGLETDARDAFSSSLRKLITKSAKGDIYLQKYKIGVAMYHTWTLEEHIGFPEEFREGHEGGMDWESRIRNYEPMENSTTNIVAAYRVAVKWIKAHRAEHPDSCIVVLNITDGEHNEHMITQSNTHYQADVTDDATVTQIATEILEYDEDREGDELDGRCILGYLWYGSSSPSFPTKGSPVRCSRLPPRFIQSLKKHNSKMIAKYQQLKSEGHPYFFMSPSSLVDISDFIEIGTSQQTDSSVDDSVADEFDELEGLYD